MLDCIIWLSSMLMSKRNWLSNSICQFIHGSPPSSLLKYKSAQGMCESLRQPAEACISSLEQGPFLCPAPGKKRATEVRKQENKSGESRSRGSENAHRQEMGEIIGLINQEDECSLCILMNIELLAAP